MYNNCRVLVRAILDGETDAGFTNITDEIRVMTKSGFFIKVTVSDEGFSVAVDDETVYEQ